jgi:hypothetical protein
MRRAAVLGGAALLAWPFVEPQLPVLRRTSVPVLAPGARPLRVLHLSDLHLLPRHRRRAAWGAGSRAAAAGARGQHRRHLSSADAADMLVDTLGALTQHAPGVFVTGNNDHYSPIRPPPDGLPAPAATGAPQADLPWGDAGAGLVRAGLDGPDAAAHTWSG